jgi:phosphatidate cytidylyltransferase
MAQPDRKRIAPRDFLPQGTDRYRDIVPRVLTALTLGAIILGATIFLPDLGWAVVVSGLAVMCTIEFYALTRRDNRHPNELFGLVAVAAMPISAALWGSQGLLGVLTALALLALTWQVIFREVTIVDSALTVFGAVYAGFMLSHLVLMRALPDGRWYVITLFASVWASDVGAYFAGTALGRHKMAPDVSPGKSWEGAVAGGLAATATWMIARYFIRGDVSLLWFTIVGVGVAVAAIVGDLVESRIKREAGAKDSGDLLPGHGGFLDRFDSVIAASVVAYYLLVWAGR